MTGTDLIGPITMNIIRQAGGYGAQAWDFHGNRIEWLIMDNLASLVPIAMSGETHPLLVVKGPDAFPSNVQAYIDWFGIACYAWNPPPPPPAPAP